LTASMRERGRRLLFPAFLFLAFSLSLPSFSISMAETKTITYTSLSTITEGTVNATITIIQFATTIHTAANATKTIAKYVNTTTIFVDVRYEVTKAPKVLYYYTTITIPRTFTFTDVVFVQTTLSEATLTTYVALPLIVDDDVNVKRMADERLLMLYLCIVALIALATLILIGWKARIFNTNLLFINDRP
jgi:hypothetical protein